MDSTALLSACTHRIPTLHQWMRHPIRWGDWLYACNGAILLRIPDQEGIMASHREALPEAMPDLAAHLGRAADGAGSAITLPDLPAPISCRHCNGTGNAMAGDEEDACWPCDGTGRQQQAVWVGDGAALFDRRLLAILAPLPDLRFHLSRDTPETGPAYATFTAQGGQGEAELMPLHITTRDNLTRPTRQTSDHTTAEAA